MSSLTWLATATSTNSVARDGDFHHGDAVATLNQTAGRGRRGREWHDVQGRGLALSVRLDPLVVAEAGPLTLVPLVAGVALVDVLASRSTEASCWVKWPNDVYLGEHKVAGILTELVDPSHMIVGMGVNVSHSATELPLESATSLALHGINIDPVTLAQDWLSGFMKLVDVLGTPGTLDHLRSRMGLMGDEVVVDMPDNTTIEGTVTALEPTGELIVSNGIGNHTILAGEIQRLRRRS